MPISFGICLISQLIFKISLSIPVGSAVASIASIVVAGVAGDCGCCGSRSDVIGDHGLAGGSLHCGGGRDGWDGGDCCLCWIDCGCFFRGIHRAGAAMADRYNLGLGSRRVRGRGNFREFCLVVSDVVISEVVVDTRAIWLELHINP